MESIKSNIINMNKKDLEKLSKSELIKLLLKQERKNKPQIIIVDDTKPSPKPRKPVPTPRTYCYGITQPTEKIYCNSSTNPTYLFNDT